MLLLFPVPFFVGIIILLIMLLNKHQSYDVNGFELIKMRNGYAVKIADRYLADGNALRIFPTPIAALAAANDEIARALPPPLPPNC